MGEVIVIGGGAAGMMAAISAAQNGHQVHLLEKNDRLGKKLFLSGKGRCNLTNAGDQDAIFASVVRNPKFFYSAFSQFSNEEAMRFFEGLGVPLKVERGNRVFPCSDHSSDVIKALEKAMDRLNVDVRLNCEVKQVKPSHQAFSEVMLKDGKVLKGDACIVTTGGLSYPSTGSTGDGYDFARQAGHEIRPLFPSLVPMEVKEDYVRDLQGLSLRNTGMAISEDGKKIYEDFGELLFTHFGVSGPIILSASSVIGDRLDRRELEMELDLKPALSMEQLDKRLLRDFEENKNRFFKNSLQDLFPAKLRPVMVRLSGIPPEKQVNEISRQERERFLHLIKHFPMTLTGLRGYDEAVVTRGGVNVNEIYPGTMESKKVKNLYFAGEVLDLDGLTGGINLQIAWSTGYTAGHSI